jgi:transporter family-2 protein
MSPLAILFSLLALFAGFLFPFQAGVNSQLGRAIGGPIAATMISFAFGLAVIVTANLVAFRQIPTIADIAKQPIYLLASGGTIGAIFLGASVFLAPRIGAGALLCLVVAGQLLGAMVIDRFGLFGLTMRELSFGRLAGAALVLAGALIVRLA